MAQTYDERDGTRIIFLRSDDGGDTWYPDVSGGGNPLFTATAPMADAAMAPGQFHFWSDDNNVYIKLKTSGGVIKTATIPVA